MAIELNNRTKILAGVVVLLAAGAGAWFFLFQDDTPPPRTVVVTPAATGSKAAPKPAADAPKTADAAKAGEAPKAAAAAPAVAKPAAQPSAKPIPTNPDQLIAEVIETSGVKPYFLVIGREAALNALSSDQGAPAMNAADIVAAAGAVERQFEPGKLTAEIAANLKSSLDAERMARFLEVLRQPTAVKMAARETGKLTPDAVREIVDTNRKTPPSAPRAKLIQSLDEVARSSEIGADMANAMARTMIDAMLESMQKGAKGAVPVEARQAVGAQLNAIRSQARGQIRNVMFALYRDASDEELTDYLKLLDTDTGRWGMDRLAEAMRPALVSRGAAIGKEIVPFALARRVDAMAKAPAAAAPEPLPKAQAEQPAEKPAAAAAATPAEPVGYQRAANIRELYTRYNDLISATVMRDRGAVKELLDDGKFPNARQSDGTTPLMIAVANGDADIAGMLLAKGADPNLRAASGTSALSIAKARGSAGAELVQLLQRSGAKE